MDNYKEHLETEKEQKPSHILEDYALGFEVSKLGEIFMEIREKQYLTQEELAQKCGTSTYYISKIENNILDIPISALSFIVRQGLNGH